MTKIRKNSKKHRGIRDPFKQLDAKYKLVKDKINNPPKNSNDQEICKVSKSFQCKSRPIADKLKRTGQKKLKSKSTLVDTSRFISTNIGEYPKSGRGFKPIPTLSQRPNEVDYKFFRRVHKATEVVKHEAEFQDKYKVEVKRDETGQVTGYNKRHEYQSKKKLEEAIARKEKKKLKNKEHELRKKYKKMKKFRRLNRSDSSDEEGTGESSSFRKNLFKKDIIKFGEIVHAPPTLETTAIEKKVIEGKNLQIKNFLFLQSLKSPSSRKKKEDEEESKLRKKVLEIEREKAVFAYKQLKANKNSSLR